MSDDPAGGAPARNRRPLIGVIGGLGPAATLDLYASVLALTPATTDQEHVRLIIDADPEVPDRNRSVAGLGPSSAPALIAKAERLRSAGADLLVMACNAAHAYRDQIVAAVGLPFVSIVDQAVAAVGALAPDAKAVAVLATTGTLDAGLYQEALARSGREVLALEGAELERFMELIYRVKGGDTGPQARAQMTSLASSLLEAGAEAIVAACTEVPLVLDEVVGPDRAVPLIDATDALARAIVAAGRPRAEAAAGPAGGPEKAPLTDP